MIIDGRKIADYVLGELRKEIIENNLDLSLGAVLVGDDPEFKKFVDLKSRIAEKIGISFTIYKFPEDIKTKDLKKNMQEICQWSDGVLVELPLPKNLDQQAILNEVSVEKDVDVLSDEAQKLFYENKSKILPPAVEASKIVFEKYEIDLKGKKAAVFGYGVLVGKPMAHWLVERGAEVSIIRSKTEKPEEFSKQADIIISGVGKPGLITGDMVKKDVIIMDFGYGKIGDKMAGDVDYKTVSKKSDLITPVPGGMGPVLIAAVLKNLVELNKK
jgi:methylenetetrahydrofolate dehydrogenase (NADP+) / methenyltetrahydrofolate cyclohydrolase